MFELHGFSDDDDDYQVAVFARDRRRAEQVYEAVEHDLGLLPDGWLGGEWDTWAALGLVRHQWEAERRCIEGIGVYHSVTGWEILPIDYAAFGFAPAPDRVDD